MLRRRARSVAPTEWPQGRAGRRRRFRRARFERPGLVPVLVVVALLGVVIPLIAPAPSALADGGSPSDLPALESATEVVPPPEVPVGDFSTAPIAPAHPATLPAPTPPIVGFDPVASTLIPSLTTASQLVYANADGSRTAEITSGPTRYQDGAGAWVAYDMALVLGTDAMWHATAAPNAARIAPVSTGSLATMPTAAGDAQYKVVGAAPLIGAQIDGNAVRFADLLGPGRSVVLTPTRDGLEDALVLAAPATAASSFSVQFTVPSGVTARQGSTPTAPGDEPIAAHVEFVDASGNLIGSYGGGLASDSVTPLPATAPVTSSFISQLGAVVTITNTVDASWIASGDRVFPMTIDPYMGWATTTASGSGCPSYPWSYSGSYACDLFVNSDTSWQSALSSQPQVFTGSPGFWEHDTNNTVHNRTRTYLRFPTGTFGDPGNQPVVETAEIKLFNLDGGNTAAFTYLALSEAMPWSGMTWQNQPSPFEDTAVPHSELYAAKNPGSYQTWHVQQIADAWFGGYPNNGVVLWAGDEYNTSGWRKYASSEYAGGSYAPTLKVTYDRPPEVTLNSPANGVTLSNLTPTLSATVTDPDGNAVQNDAVVYDANGAVAWESGWTSASSWTVPAGELTNGRTYWWFVESDDGSMATDSDAWSFGTPNTPPPPSSPSAPADGSVVLQRDITLSSTSVSDADSDPVKYWFQVTSNGAGSGAVIDSGWLSSSAFAIPNVPSFNVPASSLQDGLTYTWRVYTYDDKDMTAPTAARTFRVNQRLGAQAPLPYDTVGPVAVNLFNGNVVTSTSSPTFATVAGPLGVSYTYNSQAPTPNGLRGSYWSGCQSPPSTWPPTASPSLVRLDPQIAFNWDNLSPSSSIEVDNFCARWAGYINAPAGTYSFGVADDQGARVSVDGTTVVDRWSASLPPSPNTFTATYGSSIALPGGPVPIIVDYYENTGPAFLSLYAQPSSGSAFPVPSSWLTPDAQPPLPRGWTVSAGLDGAVQYTRAIPGESAVVLVDATAGVHTFTATPPAAGTNSVTGYTPPVDDQDAVLTRDGTGQLTLQRADGGTYVFDRDGVLRSLTFASDDRNPAAPQYGYTNVAAAGNPLRLTTITDPVGASATSRQITLTYQTATGSCPTTGFATPPSGMLCKVTYWDGTTTNLLYNAGGQLSRIQDPGDVVTDFAYDTAGRMWKIRDPRAADAVAASRAPDDDTSRTLITYNSSGRADAVTLAKALTTDTTRPSHSYTYTSATRTRVNVAGLSPASGYARQVDFDTTGRLTADVDATGVASSASWDVNDQPLSSTDPAGRVSNVIYDPATHLPTDSYGPAPATCFGSDRKPNNAQSCAPVPHTQTIYDGGIAGLAAAYWPNLTLQGAPRVHSTGVGRGASAGSTADATGALSANWGTSGVPDVSLTASGWSARYTGDITFPSAPTGSYLLRLNLTGWGRLYIDDTRVVDSWSESNGQTIAYTVANAAGSRHRVTVEFRPGSSGANLQLLWTPPSGTQVVVPGVDLHPRYGLATDTTVEDTAGSSGSHLATSYAAPENGRVSSTTQDPGGLDLVSTIDYEPSAFQNGRFLRPIRRTLPAANATTYAYYGADTSASLANPCATGSPAVDQGGALWKRTSPDPDGTGPQAARVEEFVYDTAGRTVASRINNEPWACVTYDTRGRPLTRTIAAFGGAPARTVTYNWAVGGDTLATSISDAAGTIATSADLLGRAISNTDVWGKTTTTSYDQPGRAMSSTGPQGTIGYSYSDAGRPTAQTLDGNTIATATYDATTGELTGASYPSGAGNAGNGSSLASIGRDTAGRLTALTWNQADGTALTSDTVTRSQSGRVVDELIDGADAYTTGNNFAYDNAGRLTSARVPGHTLTYEFSSANSCGIAAAGKNTNRTSMVDNADPAVGYCYDNADRLTSTTDPRFAAVGYDSHGNTTTLGTQTLGYDGADRHISTVDSAQAPANQAPSSSAGTDQQAAPSAAVTLHGSGSDPEGAAITYAWTQTSGTTVTLSSTTTASSTFTAPASAATLRFRVVVSDPSGATGVDDVQVFVVAGQSITFVGATAASINSTSSLALNVPSGTQAGDLILAAATHRNDCAVTFSGTSNTLIGAFDGGTADPWLPTVDVYRRIATAGMTSVNFSGSCPKAGALYVVRGADTSNPVDATTQAAATGTGMTAPGLTTTVAGDQLVGVFGAVNYSNSNSWTTPNSMTNRGGTTSLNASIAVADEPRPTAGATSYRSASFSTTAQKAAALIAIKPATSGSPTDQAPVAAAGVDQEVAVNSTVALSGSGSDPDGASVGYQWTQTSGPAVTLSSSTAAAPTFTAPSTATTLRFRLVVTDAAGGTGADDVQVIVGSAAATITMVGTTVNAINSSSNLVLTVPAGTAAGDLVLAAATHRKDCAVTFNGSNNTLVGSFDGGTTDNTRPTIDIYRKVATAGLISVSFSGSCPKSGALYVLHGADTNNPVEVSGSAYAPGTGISVSGVTTTTPGDQLLGLFGAVNYTGSNSWTTPAAMTNQGTTTSQNSSTAVADEARATAGATGSRSASFSTTAHKVAALLAIRPAGVTTTVTYLRDATDTIVERRVNGTTIARYSNGAVLDATNTVIERTIPLLGGATITTRSLGDVWSYPNIHGDIAATANGAGTKQGGTVTYDPYGQPVGSAPDNSAGSYDYGWLGQHQRGLEHEATINTIEMGARQYVPGLGRFLEVDPVEGGCANDYMYVHGDPVNSTDLTGAFACNGASAHGGHATFELEQIGYRDEGGRYIKTYQISFTPDPGYERFMTRGRLRARGHNPLGKHKYTTLGRADTNDHSYPGGILGVHRQFEAIGGDTIHITGRIDWQKGKVDTGSFMWWHWSRATTQVDFYCTA